MKSITHIWRKRISANRIAESTETALISRDTYIESPECKIVDVNSSLGHKSSILSRESQNFKTLPIRRAKEHADRSQTDLHPYLFSSERAKSSSEGKIVSPINNTSRQ